MHLRERRAGTDFGRMIDLLCNVHWLQSQCIRSASVDRSTEHKISRKGIWINRHTLLQATVQFKATVNPRAVRFGPSLTIDDAS